VIVDDLDVMGVTVAPDKAEPESVVDPDAVLTPPVAAQRFQPVSGEDRQVPKLMGRVQLPQFPLSVAGDCLKAAGRPPVEEPLGFFRPERPDHELEGYNAQRYMSSGMAASLCLAGCQGRIGFASHLRAHVPQAPLLPFLEARRDVEPLLFGHGLEVERLRRAPHPAGAATDHCQSTA
jgi:hypothetical protein